MTANFFSFTWFIALICLRAYIFPPRAGFNTMKTKLFRIKYNSIGLFNQFTWYLGEWHQLSPQQRICPWRMQRCHHTCQRAFRAGSSGQGRGPALPDRWGSWTGTSGPSLRSPVLPGTWGPACPWGCSSIPGCCTGWSSWRSHYNIANKRF